MSIFNQKNQDDNVDDDASLEEDLRVLRKLRKQRIENKKKRREPPKPWGKKERYLVGITLLATVLISAISAMGAREWKLAGVKRFKLPSLNIFKEETITIGEKKTVSDEELFKSEKVINEFVDKTNKLSGVYAFSAINLSSGYGYGVNEDELMEAASLIKLPVMALSFKQAEEGLLNLDEKYSLKGSDKVAGSGSLFGKAVGYQITYREILKLMGQESDNTAFNIMRQKYGDGAINTFAQSLGMKNTDITKNQTTADDIGLFFQNLYLGKILSEQNKEELLTNLTKTIYEDYLPKGVPIDVRVAHKFGREAGVLNDAGIIFAPKPYILVLMSKGTIAKEVETFFPEIIKSIYQSQN
jgi:beta-lactamase class A